MEWIKDLLWGSGIGHSILIISATIAAGILLGKIKVFGISLGVTFILFVGILFGHLGFHVDPHLLHFFKEFGLILFVFSIGMQVGPGFFSSFKKGGLTLNMLAATIVFLGAATTVIIHFATGTPMSTMVGVMSGAVTNTPGLGAAQQAYNDLFGQTDQTIALGYAVAYPLGVVGIILALLFVRYIFRVSFAQETDKLIKEAESESNEAEALSLIVRNPAIHNHTVAEISKILAPHEFVISRIQYNDTSKIETVNGSTTLHEGDKIFVITTPQDEEAIKAFIGEVIEMDRKQWIPTDSQLISRRIVVTKSELSGKRLKALQLRRLYGVNVTRVNRAGMDLVAYPELALQVGDRLTVVGSEVGIAKVSDLLGNSMKRLREPNMITIFFGISLGIILGSIPIAFPGIPQPVKLGLAGGPLIVALLISRFGYKYKLITYTTISANLMLREIGISLFLACVGIGAGDGFVDTIVNQGGLSWVGYGFIITILPLLIVGCIARGLFKMNYFTIMGLIAGSTTDPPALAYSNATAGNDAPAVGYATVYPLTMFLRVLTAQLLILFFYA